MAIAVIIEFDVKPECLAEFEAKLRHDAAETLRDDGCLRMEIVHPRDAPQRIVLSELWRNEAAIAAHRAKPGHTHAWQETLIQRKRSIVGEVQ